MPKELQVAIIAALAALSGVAVSATIQILLATIDRRHKKQTLLRQKFEEMFFHFASSVAWTSKLHCAATVRELLPLAIDGDARKALSLCVLYFPALSAAANEYVQAESDYYNALLASHNTDQPPPLDLLEKIRLKKVAFEELVIKEAPKYTIA